MFRTSGLFSSLIKHRKSHREEERERGDGRDGAVTTASGKDLEKLLLRWGVAPRSRRREQKRRRRSLADPVGSRFLVPARRQLVLFQPVSASPTAIYFFAINQRTSSSRHSSLPRLRYSLLHFWGIVSFVNVLLNFEMNSK